MHNPYIALVVGSENDIGKIKGSLERVQELKNYCDIELYVCSADRAPKTAEHILTNTGADAIICAAGLSNMLANNANKLNGYANKDVQDGLRPHVPVIALPIGSTTFGGVDSVLSTSQKPEGYQIPTVGVNKADTAINVAYNMIRENWDSVVLLNGMLVDNTDETFQSAKKTLEFLLDGSGIDIHTERSNRFEHEKGCLPLLVFESNASSIYEVERKSDLCIATKKKTPVPDTNRFFEILSEPEITNTAFVTAGNGKALAYAGAEILAMYNDVVRQNIIDSLKTEEIKYSAEQKGKNIFRLFQNDALEAPCLSP